MSKFLTLLLVLIIPMFWILNQNSKAYNSDRDDWEKFADKRIEKYRKGNLDIQIKNSLKKELILEVVQTRHAFSFGSAVTASMLLDTSEIGDKYRSVILKYFNEVVLENDLKWSNWLARNSAKYSKEQTLKALKWLNDHKIKVRGHYLIWCPLQKFDKLKSVLTPTEYETTDLFTSVLRAHIFEKIQETGPSINEWDFLNHPVSRGHTDQVDVSGKKMLLEDYLGPKVYENIFSQLKSTYPAKRMFVNEGNVLTRSGKNYYDYLDFVRNLNFNPDGIGFMGHFEPNDLPQIDEVFKKLGNFSKFHLPLKITEFDIMFGEKYKKSEMTKEDLLLQKYFSEDFLKICFSHPQVEGFLIWGFWEKAHWYPNAALWDETWNIKPNGKAIIDLMFNKWWTHYTCNIINGKKRIRGFLGDYIVRVKATNGEELYQDTFCLPKKGVVLKICI